MASMLMCPTKSRRLRSIALALATFAVLQHACADGLRPDGFFVEGGLWQGRTWNGTVGAVWPWAWKRALGSGELGAITEAYVSHWDTPALSGRRGITQVGVVPLLRLRSERGSSPWFAEAGIGVSTTDRRFETLEKRFTTNFNFVDILGVGRSFGTSPTQEIGVRIQHVSNAGIRSPNPGQNFLLLRYASAF
ncbi:MAG: acyloxyacyl hydrolase [Ramlibacter sp.]